MNQYSTRMVIVHWLTLVLLVVAYFLGDALDESRHEGGATTLAYLVHSLVGGAVLLLVALRLNFRSVDGTPPPLGDALMDRVAKGVHYLLYAVLVLLPVSGVMLVLTSSVGTALLAGDASLLPAKYTGLSSLPHNMHELLVTVLMLLVGLHVLGALKHQFLMKDGLIERMYLKRKS